MHVIMDVLVDSAAPLAFTNQKYMSPPLLRNQSVEIESVDNAANCKKSSERAGASKYLDECDTYTDDGYMQHKHIYADVAEMGVPAPSIAPGHYDVPEAVRNGSVADVYLYDRPQDVLPNSQLSPSYSNIPATAGAFYDVPRRSLEVADEYASGPKAMESKADSPEAPAHYDVPKYKLNSFKDTNTDSS